MSDVDRYYVALGRPSWSGYEEHTFDSADEVIAFKEKNAWSDWPVRVIYGTELVFEPAVVVKTYRLVPLTETFECVPTGTDVPTPPAEA